MKPSTDPQACALVAVTEFTRANLGDARLNRRLLASVEKLARNPALSYPQAMPEPADLEGWYRLMENKRVTASALRAPHVEQTWKRCSERKVVLAVADSTAMKFGGEDVRAGLGHISARGDGHGFMLHPTLMIAADGTREVLGVVRAKSWARLKDGPPSLTQARRNPKLLAPGETALPSERNRWWEEAEAAQRDAPNDVELIHVMDREADSNAIMANMSAAGMRFVIRLCRDRRLAADGAGLGPPKLREHLDSAQAVCTRPVQLSFRSKKGNGNAKRVHPARREREAQLSFSAASVLIKTSFPPPSSLPEKLAINVVHVWEANPVEGEPAVDWVLMTTDPIETEEQILAIIDIYRARWLIEEFFMALKTGCAYERRQMESFETLEKALAVTLPLAWMLMRLRTIARETPDRPATAVLTEMQLRVLRLHCTEEHPKLAVLAAPTARNAMLALARMGGHLTRNGEPGWRTLAAGFFVLLRLITGFEMGLKAAAG